MRRGKFARAIYAEPAGPPPQTPAIIRAPEGAETVHQHSQFPYTEKDRPHIPKRRARRPSRQGNLSMTPPQEFAHLILPVLTQFVIERSPAAAAG